MSRLFDRRNWSRLAMLLLCSYWIAMFAGTHWPTTPQFIHGTSDKIWHFLGYTGLATLCSVTWALGRPTAAARLSLQQCALIVLLLAAYGGLDEITQPLVGRSCELLDWVADLSGTCAGVAAVQWLLLVAEKLIPQNKRT